jgi:DNA polymerase II small subunit
MIEIKNQQALVVCGDLVTSTERRSVLRRVLDSGHQITPDALEYIMNLDSPLVYIEQLMSGGMGLELPPVLSHDFLSGITMELVDPVNTETLSTMALTDYDVVEVPPADQEENAPGQKYVILKNPELSDVGSAGIVEDFLALFADRFSRTKKIFMKRIDTQSAVSPEVARQRKDTARRQKMARREGGRASRPPNQMVLGMVRSKNVSQSRNVVIELEDSDGSITCVIPSGREGLKGTQTLEKGNSVLLDEIICVSGYVDQDGRMIAHDVIFPDVPTARTLGRAKRDVYACFISDLHCGSAEFLEDEINSFIDWLRGADIDGEDKKMVERTEYLFIAGDIVDGIGVYPNQEENLVIPDLNEQYAHAAEILSRVPDRITMFAIPGNHDACRQALPKPAIPEAFAKPLYDLGDRMVMLGDPSHIRVEGVEVMLTHGDSMDDLVVNTPGASYVNPAIGMKELLRKRHLAPLYGGKTELAPLSRDWMVIDTPPDIVHFGHAHHNAADNYRGIQIINSGTFQGQTDFMRKQGIVPTPGLVTLVNLRTGEPTFRPFFDFNKLERNGD